MRLWDFAHMKDGKITVSPKIGEPLGLVDGSEVFSSMFRYEVNGRASYEIVLSPFGPENYREIAYITFQVRDEPGALAQAALFMKSRNVDILNSETVSSVPNVMMVWEMLADLSFYGDSLSLRKEFEDAKAANDPALSLVDAIAVEVSDLATRYTRGAAVDSSRVKTKVLRRTERKASVIKNGVFELPQAYMNFLGKTTCPIMLIGEPSSWVLSIAFLADDVNLSRLSIDLPDRPGAIHEVTKVLGEESLNVLAGYSNVLVYYERMVCEFVVDERAVAAKEKADLKDVLKKRMESLGPQFRLVEMTPVTL